MRYAILYTKHLAKPMVSSEGHSWGNQPGAIPPNLSLPGHLELGEGDTILDEQGELLCF